jgi:hypothetical protein
MNGQDKCTNGQNDLSPKNSSYFDIGKVSPFSYFVFVAGGLGLLIALVTREQASPYGLPSHLLQWQIQSFLAIALLIMTHIAIARWIPFFKKNPWIQLIISGFFGSLLFSLPAMAMDILFEVDPAPISLSSFFLSWLDEFDGVFLPICIAWVAMNAPWLLGLRLTYQSVGIPENIRTVPFGKDTAIRPPFSCLVKNPLWGNLIYLKSELQYLKVVTDKGGELILYNLRDAINELPGGKGIQPHRSFWVANSAVLSFQIKGRQGELLLIDGTKVPVSRSNLNRIKNHLRNLGIEITPKLKEPQ